MPLLSVLPADNRGLHVPETAAGEHTDTKWILYSRCTRSESPFNPPIQTLSILQGQIIAHCRMHTMTSLHLHVETILTFDYETHSEWGWAVALLLHAGVIPLVFWTEAGELQVGLPIVGKELLTVLLPGQLELGGALRRNRLQRTVQSIWRLLLPHIEHLLLKPALIHTGVSYK